MDEFIRITRNVSFLRWLICKHNYINRFHEVGKAIRRALYSIGQGAS